MGKKKIKITREDEIIDAAYEYIDDHDENPILGFGDFINGAKWADITLLNKLQVFMVEHSNICVDDIYEFINKIKIEGKY